MSLIDMVQIDYKMLGAFREIIEILSTKSLIDQLFSQLFRKIIKGGTRNQGWLKQANTMIVIGAGHAGAEAALASAHAKRQNACLDHQPRYGCIYAM